jgi:hypothetical protein
VLVCLLLVPTAGASFAQDLREVIPLQEPNCALTAPPDAAGLATTPGGFVMVYPRNAALPKAYTGCKALWVVDGERYLRLATLYFKSGKLKTAAAHGIRDAAAKVDAACAFPEGKSLLPETGIKMKDQGCAGFGGGDFYALHVPTWPRSCLTQTDAAVCQQDPR